MKNLRICICLIGFTTAFTYCGSRNQDVLVKKDLAAKAKAELSFLGVRFLVDNGIVTLNGTCATTSARDEVYTKVRGLYGVENVINNIGIGEVIIGRDWLLKQSVDSVLTEYAQVEAITRDSMVLLQGRVDAAKMQKLLLTIRALQPERLVNHLININH